MLHYITPYFIIVVYWIMIIILYIALLPYMKIQLSFQHDPWTSNSTLNFTPLARYFSTNQGLFRIYSRWNYIKIHQRGGAVETGCSGSHHVIGCFTIWYCRHPLHPPPTAPPFDEFPIMIIITIIMMTTITAITTI